MSTENGSVESFPNDEKEQIKLKAAKCARPSLQIYRPPASNASSGSRSSGSGVTIEKLKPAGETRQDTHAQKSFRAKLRSQTSVELVAPSVAQANTTGDAPAAARSPTKMKIVLKANFLKDHKKKPFTKQEADKVASSLANLHIDTEKQLIEEFVAGDMADDALAHHLGQSLVRHAVEEKKQSSKAVARICAALLASPACDAFHVGFLTALTRYVESRAELRATHSRVWINLLGFITDLYSSVGFMYEGGLVDIIFDVFNYILRTTTMESIKIEELESMMGALLSVGYDLERHCPDQLGQLQNAIRDAFIAAREPWARKMLLLLIELGASGWSLAPDANEYYFQ